MREGGKGFEPRGEGAARFPERRERVLAALGDDVMVLPAAPRLYRSRDSEVPYRPDSELYYLTGFEEPGAVLVLRGFAEEARSTLFVQARDPDAERWTGPRLGPAGAAERLGVDEAHGEGELAARLPGLLVGARNVHFRLGRHPEVQALVMQALETGRRRGPRTGTGPDGVVDPGRILDEHRLRKDPAEVRALREAGRMTVEGFREAIGAVRPGVGEWEVQAALEASFRRQGGAGPAFATIVAAGSNACVLHYDRNAARIREGDLVLIDGGAEARMYAGDVSRTVPASGRFTDEQQAVYEIVEAARVAAIEQVRPGATVDDVHEAAVETLARGLIEIGALSGTLEEIVENRTYRSWFPHRTSHWLGLDTHDPGDYVRGGESRRLEPGMVLTVEPGLYFPSPPGIAPEEGEDAPPEPPASIEGIGVRIEDDVLVTASGAEVLTAALPTAPDELAALVRAAHTPRP